MKKPRQMNNLIIATTLFAIGQIISWFNSYLQFMYPWFRDNIVLLTILLSVPGTLCFVYGMRYAYEFFQSGWAPRFYVFSLSFLIYPVLFSYFMNESFFTTKNLLCSLLAFLIILIQWSGNGKN